MELKDIPVRLWSSPPWNMAFTPAALYWSLYISPTFPGVQSTTMSTLEYMSLSVPAISTPASLKAWTLSSGT